MHYVNEYKCHSNVITSTDESAGEERRIRNTDVHTRSPSWWASNHGNVLASFCTRLTSTKIAHNKNYHGSNSHNHGHDALLH